MCTKSRLILFSKGALYLAPEARYELAQTNLASYSPKIKSNEHRFLEVDAEYERGTGTLHLTISNHDPENTSAFETQKVIAPIKQIVINGLRWTVLDSMLYAYMTGVRSASGVIDDTATSPENTEMFSSATSYVESTGSRANADKGPPSSQPYTASILAPALEDKQPGSANGTFIETFDYSYEQVVFCHGYVTVEPKFSWHKTSIWLCIPNDRLIASFGYIRGYFANALRIGKTISVSATIEMADGVIARSTAASVEIAAITDDLLELVEQKRTEDIISDFVLKEKRPIVVTAEELFESAAGGNIFAQSAEDVVRLILLREDIRNKRQLQYLAAEKHDVKEKVRFTIGRHVGFLFYFESGTRFHFCWELLNSNATYIWSFDTRGYAIQSALPRLETAISKIYSEGRQRYKKDYAAGFLDADFSFHAIHHANEGLGEDAAFERWRNKVIARVG